MTDSSIEIECMQGLANCVPLLDWCMSMDSSDEKKVLLTLTLKHH